MKTIFRGALITSTEDGQRLTVVRAGGFADPVSMQSGLAAPVVGSRLVVCLQPSR